MADLSTSYMGIPLSSPVLVAACSVSGMIDNIRRCEEAGAGALVIRSLFEEQIQLEGQRLDEQQAVGSERFAESLSYFPPLEHAGPREHLMWTEKTRKAVSMPLIGSINAVHTGQWVKYARQMQDTGVNALELNPYAVQTDVDRSASDVEAELLEVVQSVLDAVTIPVSVKLSPFYTSVPHVAHQLDERGVKGLVLFNRFLQPDIDLDTMKLRQTMNWSRPEEARLALRYVAILHGRVGAELAATGGIHDGQAVARQLLAGAQVVQVASVLYTSPKKLDVLTSLNDQLGGWMDEKGYAKIESFRGRLSQAQIGDPYAFERAQYVQLLMKQKM